VRAAQDDRTTMIGRRIWRWLIDECLPGLILAILEGLAN
jgi:hypothetical protein